MFGQLSDKIGKAIDTVRGKGRVRASDIEEIVEKIKISLLEADVNFKVAQNLVKGVSSRLINKPISPMADPRKVLVSTIKEEITTLLGTHPEINFKKTLVCGLQGTGKTTTVAKLTKWLERKKYSPVMVPIDVHRAAATEQLMAMGKQHNLRCFDSSSEKKAKKIARKVLETHPNETLVFDTAGRLEIDNNLMKELKELHKMIEPTATILVVDSMTGQRAVQVAQAFHENCPVDGLIFTKTDGDSRGGAALSIRSVTGIPIVFLGTGENIGDLEPFEAERIASRILGLGDLAGFVEKAEFAMEEAQSTVDNDDLADIENFGNFKSLSLEDFLRQLKVLKKMGPLKGIMGMIPGFAKVSKGLNAAAAEGSLKRIEAMIQSMTPQERLDHKIINGSRKKRIATGSGTKIEELNRFLKQYEQMKKMLKKMNPAQIPANLSRRFGGF